MVALTIRINCLPVQLRRPCSTAAAHPPLTRIAYTALVDSSGPTEHVLFRRQLRLTIHHVKVNALKPGHNRRLRNSSRQLNRHRISSLQTSDGLSNSKESSAVCFGHISCSRSCCAASSLLQTAYVHRAMHRLCQGHTCHWLGAELHAALSAMIRVLTLMPHC
jgi:hypothetical protein